MSQVNLLPPEDRSRASAHVGSPVSWRSAARILVGLLLAFYLLQVGRLGGVEDDIAGQQRTNSAIQDEIDALVKYEDLQVQAQQSQSVLDAAYANELSFSQALMDVSRVTPSDSFLDAFGINVTGGTPTDSGVTFVGTVSLSGQAVGMETVASWINRLEEITGWVNPWRSRR